MSFFQAIFIIGDKIMKNQKTKKTKGFTIIELVVSLGIFTLIMGISAGILLNSLRMTRFVAIQARAIDNISLIMEQIVREVRTSSNFEREEGLVDKITFTNYEGRRITYSFCGTSICRNNQPITAENVVIKGGFYITDFRNTKTPRITIAARATSEAGEFLGSLQTGVSGRLIFYRQPI
jgi:prepilin-type N-terminal cleavage/methylation domain-containing protein